MVDNSDRKQVGCAINIRLYKKMRQQALENRDVGRLIDDAMKMYLEKAQQENKSAGKQTA